MYGVYKKSPGGVKEHIRVFKNEIDAADFCDQHGWELRDENGFLWELDYAEV